MSTDWAVLVKVRERRMALAQERVASERHASEQMQSAVQQARDHHSAVSEAKRRLWQRVADGQVATLSVGDLRQTSTWSGALDARLAAASGSVRSALQDAARQQARLDTSREQLRDAAAQFAMADELRRRSSAEQLRQRETRLEDHTESVASQSWTVSHATSRTA